VEHLEASLKGLDFDSSDHEAICSPTKLDPFGRSKEFTPERDDDDDDDDDADDDGGVKL
jgi:hypothetical protein